MNLPKSTNPILARIGVVAFLFFATLSPVRGCDLCGCYTPQLMTEPDHEMALGPARLHGWYAAVAEQFTHFGTLQEDGNEVRNPTGQYLNSSITQLIVGHGVTPRLALQLNLPVIYREFKRPEGFMIDHGTESGIGDLSLLARFTAWQYAPPGRRTVLVDLKNPVMKDEEPDFTASLVLLAGVKFPTGDTSRLLEEFHEGEVPGAPESGIHGHDLTLGTGSYDGIFGVETSTRYRNFFFDTTVQFTLRGDGVHEYNFANDLVWAGGPGYYVVRNPKTVVGVQFVVGGEHKDVDRFRGAPAEDTGITTVTVGPRVVASFGRFSAEIAAEFPVSIDNTALQAVPDYRLRGGVSVHF